MTAPDIIAGIFALAYTLGAFVLAMGAAVVGRFVWEVIRNGASS